MTKPRMYTAYGGALVERESFSPSEGHYVLGSTGLFPNLRVHQMGSFELVNLPVCWELLT